MGQIQDYLYITLSKDRMLAKVHCTNVYSKINRKMDVEEIYQLLVDNNIKFGVDQKVVKSLVSILPAKKFPFIIAKGKLPEHGEDGKVLYGLDFNPQVDRTANWNFRDVMRIPSVKKGQQLATITLPSKGKDGKDVCGNPVQARPGKQANISAGENVVYHEETKSFFAAEVGQVSTKGHYLGVESVYEVNGNLSMETGNLDFVGSITIHGDVPTGYTVKAAGDIKVFGMVEAASISAGGSVFISEGIAGLQKGYIQAKENVHIGYINQGVVHANQSIYVDNSIIHSECVAKNDIICLQGNIIGGSLSAGKTIEAKNIGNRLNTKTTIHLGENKSNSEEIEKLKNQQKELQNALSQLEIIGKSLEDNMKSQDVKARITLLRQRSSYEQTEQQLTEISEKLEERTAYLGCEEETMLIVRNYLYPNAIIAFGTYQSKIKKTIQYTKVQLKDNEISIQALK